MTAVYGSYLTVPGSYGVSTRRGSATALMTFRNMTELSEIYYRDMTEDVHNDDVNTISTWIEKSLLMD